jgi:choline kinase
MGYATRNIIAASRPRQNRKYSIVIPAAGLSTRMKKYGPKSLTQITPRETILDRQIRIIESVFRWYEIILVAGFEHDKLVNTVPSKVKTVYNKHYDTTNVVYSLNLGLNECTTDNVIILYGDLIFNKPTISVPFDQESAAVIANSMKSEEIGCNINNGYIEQMFYGIPNKWAQILFLCGKELKLMQNFVSIDSNAECYGFEAVNYILRNNGKIRAYQPLKAKALDIDTSLDLKRIPLII